jgi:hypothetical protein
MKILYKKILDLELWHDYYLGQRDLSQSLPENYDLSDTLTLAPTPECQRSLQNLRWSFRPKRYGATLWAEVEPAKTGPFRTKFPLDRGYQLAFWLVVRAPLFANFTNLPITPLNQQIYYFTNLSGNEQKNTLFLTRSLPFYNNGTSYEAGQLVTHNNQTWEAVRDRTANTADPSPDDWEALPLSQYVSPQDQLLRQGLFYSYRVPQANPDEILRFTLMNGQQQPAFEYEFTTPKNHQAGATIAVPLNFSNLPPSRYTLLLKGNPIGEFVLADPISTLNAWGFVEILVHPTSVPAAFSLLKSENGKTLIQPRTYVIRFKNRSTYWRYRYERPHGFLPDQLKTLNLHYETEKTYFTQRPQGLLQRPSHLFMDGKDRLLPAPRVIQIKPEPRVDPETQKETLAIFSDVYL